MSKSSNNSSKNGQLRSDSQSLEIRTPFAENLYIIDHAHKQKFVNVAKAGVTSIKRMVSSHNELPSMTAAELQARLGTRHDFELNQLIKNDLRADNYTRVAVYRDPYKRFVSWYNDKVLEPKQPHILTNGLAVQHDPKRMLEFLRYELGKQDSAWIDEHVRPQSRIYDLEDVDIIVRIEDLTNYLASLGAAEKESLAQNLSPRQNNNYEFPVWFVREFKKIYADDYKLIKRAKNKVWVGSKT